MGISRSISVLYCDDVRQEIGNKASYIGVYQRGLIVKELPAVIPKFCIVITAITPKTKPFKHLKFKLIKDDETILAETEINEDSLDIPFDAVSDGSNHVDDEIEIIFKTSVVFNLSPFVIEEPFFLRVRVETGEEELKGEGLRINLADTQSPISDMST